MKICFLAAANTIHSYRWIKFFADRGHEVHWISFVPSDFEPLKGAAFHEVSFSGPKWMGMINAALKVRGLIKDIAPDILHAHYVGTYGLAAALSGFRPLVVTAWGSDILFAGKSKIKGPLVKYALRRADLITCDAHHMVDAMVGLGADAEKIKIIYFGIDTERFSPGARDDALRAGLGVFDLPMVISLRNLEPVYDVESLIRAAPSVLKDFPDAKFVIGGRGSQEETLRGLAESLGLSESVRFIGRYRNEDLPGYLRSADVYVSTSLSDAGIAASTAEAMACGTAVVITDSGENGKWVEDGENGLLVPVKKPGPLAEGIKRLLGDSALRARLGGAGRKTIAERNDYHREMGKMERLYAECVKGEGGR